MGDVLHLNDRSSVIAPPVSDGGKARILKRRRNFAEPTTPDDLVMGYADSVMPCDVAYPDQPA